MPTSSSETTSSSGTTEPPGNLNICGAPGRKGTYLYIEQGSVMYAVARFRDDESVERFKEWAKAMDRLGLKIKWKGDGEEGNSEEQA
ncbi:hypothetical protein SEA_DRYAD_44 [Streptomyces phage Dryad]|nr:hypothetical protein SEA_DRYAD_44 [Streptomyces phage Dryad]